MNQSTLKFIKLNPDVPADKQPAYDLGIEVTIPKMRNQIYHDGHKSFLSPACSQMLSLVSRNLKGIFDQGPYWRKEKIRNAQNVIVATVRPDIDSITSMAILKCYVEGKSIDEYVVEFISNLDRHGPSFMNRVHMDDSKANLLRVIWMVTSEQAVCLDDRISFVVSCLDGTVDQNLVDEYTKKRHQLYQRAISRSRITHVGSGQLIFVESSDVLASSIWYEHGNTVIIKDPCTIVWEKNETTWKSEPTGDTYTRYKICKYNENTRTNLDTMLQELLSKEAGWTIQGGMIISPENITSKLSDTEIMRVANRHAH